MTDNQHSGGPGHLQPGGRQRPAWMTHAMPELRPGPPWVMQEMIAAEPGLAGSILPDPAATSIADIIRNAHGRNPHSEEASIVTTGCGTSEHGALAIAHLIRIGLGPSERVDCKEAFEALLNPPRAGVLLAVSHEGGTAVTLEALKAARSAGATTILFTARRDSPSGGVASHLFVTPLADRSWCHTVAYVSAILAGAAVAGALSGEQLPADALETYLAAIVSEGKQAADVARSLGGCSRLIISGLGPDFISARELALKIEEGARIPAAAIQLETVLHGHLAATDERTGIVFILGSAPNQKRRDARAVLAAKAAQRIGIRCAAIVSAGISAETDFPETCCDAGRIVLPPFERRGNEETVGSLTFTLTGTAVALQLLALALAEERGCNPDLIGRERESYREAAQIVERGIW